MNTCFTLLLASRAAILLHHLDEALERAWILRYDDMAALKKTLADALLARPQAPLTIMLDAEALDMRTDDLPPVSFWQRDALVARQRNFHFPGASFCGSARLDKNTRVLHAATNVDARVHKVLEGLYGIGNPVNAAAFFGIEAAHVMQRLPEMPGGQGLTLLLILGEAMGLRQILLQDGVPVFTRLNADCAPSLGEAELAPRIAMHLQATRDYIPRLGLAPQTDVEVQLLVPPMLKDIGAAADLRAAGCQVIALEPPSPDMVPPEWALDIALLTRLAGKKRVLPFAPEWLKGRTKNLIIRQDVSIIMFVFGCAGIGFGLDTLFNRANIVTPPPVQQAAPMVPAPAPTLAPQPPELKLEALIYNAPDDWSVWIDGEKYTPQASGGALKILEVLPGSVRVQWGEAQEIILTPQNGAAGAVMDGS